MSRYVLPEQPCGAIGSDHRPDPQGPGRNRGSKSNANLHDTLVDTVLQGGDGRRCAPPSADPIRRAVRDSGPVLFRFAFACCPRARRCGKGSSSGRTADKGRLTVERTGPPGCRARPSRIAPYRDPSPE